MDIFSPNYNQNGGDQYADIITRLHGASDPDVDRLVIFVGSFSFSARFLSFELIP